MILYLHGFRSSPESFKARLMADAMAARGLAHAWRCPQLPASPRAALDLALDLAQELASDHADPTSDHADRAVAAETVHGRRRMSAGTGTVSGGLRHLSVIGSSLGGFYATWLAEHLGCRAVLLNPVVHAARDLATQVGSHRTFHGNEPFEFLPAYVDELARAQADIPRLTHLQRYFLLAATGDEVLDWRDMQARYAGARQRIIQGSDHGLSDFARWLPEVLDFALNKPVAVMPAALVPAALVPAAAPANARHSGAVALDRALRRVAAHLRVDVDSWETLGPDASRIRTEVFVREQHVPPELELDSSDAVCVHAVARDDTGAPIGTGRLLPDGHIGRMAVLKAWRGQGVGSRLLIALMDEARRRGHPEVVLAAQRHAEPFYIRYGFQPEGDTFMDAGIPHVLMRRRFA